MAVSGPQHGVKYTLTGPDGTIAVFNDDTDPNYVGAIDKITGLDSAEVRESASDRVEQDGGQHGNFWLSRRPVVIDGKILATTAVDRNTKAGRLQRAARALRGDATLVWTPDGGVEQFVTVRRNQRVPKEGGWVKSFQIPFVAEDPRIYSTGLTVAEVLAGGTADVGFAFSMVFPLSFGTGAPQGVLLVVNEGDYETPPTLRIDGPITNPIVYSATLDQSITLTYTLGAGEWLELDTKEHSVLLNGTTPRNSAVNFAATEWWMLQPGQNDIRLQASAFSAGAKLTVSWRHAWE